MSTEEDRIREVTRGAIAMRVSDFEEAQKVRNTLDETVREMMVLKQNLKDALDGLTEAQGAYVISIKDRVRLLDENKVLKLSINSMILRAANIVLAELLDTVPLEKLRSVVEKLHAITTEK